MHIEVRPMPRSFVESELLIDGKVIGEVEVESDGRLCARLIIKDPIFLAGIHSSIFGHGETHEEALLNAIQVGRQQHAALGKALAELESRVLVTA